MLNAMILICEYFSHKAITINDEDKKEKLFQTTERQNWTKLSEEELKRLSASRACMYDRKQETEDN